MLQTKQILSRAFYLKEHSTLKEYIEFLEDSFSRLKNTKEDIWEVAKLIAEQSIDNAKNYEKNNLIQPCFFELNRAWKVLHPINPRWKSKIEWQLLRLTVFFHLAEYYRR